MNSIKISLGIFCFSLGVSAFMVDTSGISWWKVLIVGIAFMSMGIDLLQEITKKQ